MTIKGGRRKRTKKHKRRKTRHHKRRKRRQTKHRMRGGALPGISPAGGSPAAPFSGRWGGKMAAFPPGPMYKPGVNNDAKYYGKLDGVIAPPKNTHGSGFTRNHGKIKGGRKRVGRKSRKGGRKSRKGGRKSRKGGSKSRKGGNPCGTNRHGLDCIRCCQRTRGGPCWDDKKGQRCSTKCCDKYAYFGGGKKTRKGGRGRHKRGGSMSSFLANNVPGFSDVRDVYWKGGEVFKNGYNTWFGYDKADNTSAGVQPIGQSREVVRPELVDIPQKLKTGALSAKKYSVA